MDFQAKLIHKENGQGLGEYAMILGLVALIVALALTSVGFGVEILFDLVKNGLDAIQNLFGPR
jgi:Flp pilus assembly pilin Flp